MREFGEDVSEVLEYVPESFKVIRHVRPKFSCGRCETVVEALAPSRPPAIVRRTYLRRFPIDIIKIDRSFIADCTTSDQDAALVRAIIGMGRSLQKTLIAEGVKNARAIRVSLRNRV